MPAQRFSFHFVDEVPTDPAFWRRWVATLPLEIRTHLRGGKQFDRIEMGERRPLVWAAAPFKDRANGAETRRDDELESLETLRTLTELLREHCLQTGRSIRMLRDGSVIGRVVETGPDDALAAVLDEWHALDQARPLDALRWWRIGHASLWAGTVSADHFTRLLDDVDYDDEEDEDDDGDEPGAARAAGPSIADEPATELARRLGIGEYDTFNVQSHRSEQPRPLREQLAELRASQSLISQLPPTVLDRPVDAVIAFYETDFSNRPPDALGEGLALVGVFPYALDAVTRERFDEIEE